MDIANETQALLNEQAAKVVTGNGAEFKVHYWDVVPRHYNNPVHKHSFFEICYVLEGEGEYSENGIDYPLRAGTHFCSRPGIEHQIRSQDGMYLIYVAFEPDERSSRREAVETFRSLASSGETCVYDDGSLPSSLLWKSLMLREDGRNRLSPNALQAAAGALLLSFPSLFSSETPAPSRFTGSADVLLRQAKLYIRDNLSRDLSLREISAYLNVSERHLYVCFPEALGKISRITFAASAFAGLRSCWRKAIWRLRKSPKRPVSLRCTTSLASSCERRSSRRATSDASTAERSMIRLSLCGTKAKESDKPVVPSPHPSAGKRLVPASPARQADPVRTAS